MEPLLNDERTAPYSLKWHAPQSVSNRCVALASGKHLNAIVKSGELFRPIAGNHVRILYSGLRLPALEIRRCTSIEGIADM